MNLLPVKDMLKLSPKQKNEQMSLFCQLFYHLAIRMCKLPSYTTYYPVQYD